MNTLQMLLIVCPLVFLAGFVDSIAGGGGLISLPAYFLLNIPPTVALGSNKFSAVWGTAISTTKFIKTKKYNKKIIFNTIFFALLGSYVGTRLTLLIPNIYLKYIMIIMIPIIAVFVLTKKDFGEQKIIEITDSKLVLYSSLASLIIGSYDGFFGPGTGTFLILIFTSIFGFDILTASGNAKIINFSSNLASCITFVFYKQVLYKIAIPAAIFSILGNFIGANIALKNGKKIIKPIFVCVLMLLLITIIFQILAINK